MNIELFITFLSVLDKLNDCELTRIILVDTQDGWSDVATWNPLLFQSFQLSGSSNVMHMF